MTVHLKPVVFAFVVFIASALLLSLLPSAQSRPWEVSSTFGGQFAEVVRASAREEAIVTEGPSLNCGSRTLSEPLEGSGQPFTAKLFWPEGEICNDPAQTFYYPVNIFLNGIVGMVVPFGAFVFYKTLGGKDE